MKKQHGFTLIELMIVVAIIGIISAIGYPAFVGYTEKAEFLDSKYKLTTIADLEERFHLRHQTYTEDILTAAGLNTTDLSPNQSYKYTVKAGPLGLGDSYIITATLVLDDPIASCYTMTLSSTGARASAKKDSSDTTDICWKRD